MFRWQDGVFTQILGMRIELGFTMIEATVSVAILGILGAIAIPTALRAFQKQSLSTAADGIVNVLEQAKTQAKAGHIPVQACFRDDGQQISSAILPVVTASNCTQSTTWQSLPGIDNPKLIAINPSLSTMIPSSGLPAGYYGIQFTANGTVDPDVLKMAQKLATSLRNTSTNVRVIWVKTLLGATEVN